MHILVAPNAFKNSLDAYKAAAAIAKGLLRSRLKCTIKCFPVADGGDGTAYLLGQQLDASYFSVSVLDPLGRKIQAGLGIAQQGTTALIELADASGLRLLAPSRYNPLRATTYGTGQLIMAALEAGVSTIILGVGGSATVDGGTGCLRALGVKFFDTENNELKEPSELAHMADYSLAFLDPRLQDKKLVIVSDVVNPLLGPDGAAAVFGPQKGASPEDIVVLEKGLQRFAGLVQEKTGKDITSIPHGGAAGGVAAGLYGILGATLVNGIDYFLATTSFDDAVRYSNLVITGEGSVDAQTLAGKGPYGVARSARQFGIPVIAMAGQIDSAVLPQLKEVFDSLIPINDMHSATEEMLAATAQRLELKSYELGNRLADMDF